MLLHLKMSKLQIGQYNVLDAIKKKKKEIPDKAAIWLQPTACHKQKPKEIKSVCMMDSVVNITC